MAKYDRNIAARLVNDLMREFSLTKAQASGFVGNLAHESAGFNTLQEVGYQRYGKNARGGYGYSQWTGPRRRQFEAWVEKRGLDPASYAANWGFLRHELKNTAERAVLPALRKAKTAEDAAKIVSNRFLRPGTPHMQSRIDYSNHVFRMGSSAFPPQLALAEIPVPSSRPPGFPHGGEITTEGPELAFASPLPASPVDPVFRSGVLGPAEPRFRDGPSAPVLPVQRASLGPAIRERDIAASSPVRSFGSPPPVPAMTPDPRRFAPRSAPNEYASIDAPKAGADVFGYGFDTPRAIEPPSVSMDVPRMQRSFGGPQSMPPPIPVKTVSFKPEAPVAADMPRRTMDSVAQQAMAVRPAPEVAPASVPVPTEADLNPESYANDAEYQAAIDKFDLEPTPNPHLAVEPLDPTKPIAPDGTQAAPQATPAQTAPTYPQLEAEAQAARTQPLTRQNPLGGLLRNAAGRAGGGILGNAIGGPISGILGSYLGGRMANGQGVDFGGLLSGNSSGPAATSFVNPNDFHHSGGFGGTSRASSYVRSGHAPEGTAYRSSSGNTIVSGGNGKSYTTNKHGATTATLPGGRQAAVWGGGKSKKDKK